MDLYRKLVLAGLLMAVQFAFALNDASEKSKDRKPTGARAALVLPAHTAYR